LRNKWLRLIRISEEEEVEDLEDSNQKPKSTGIGGMAMFKTHQSANADEQDADGEGVQSSPNPKKN